MPAFDASKLYVASTEGINGSIGCPFSRRFMADNLAAAQTHVQSLATLMGTAIQLYAAAAGTYEIISPAAQGSPVDCPANIVPC